MRALKNDGFIHVSYPLSLLRVPCCAILSFPLLVVFAEGRLYVMYAIVSQFTLFFKTFVLYILVFMCYNVYIKRDALGIVVIAGREKSWA